MGQKIVLVSNTAWSIYNFRQGLIRALRTHGFEITAVAPPDEYAPRIAETGAHYIPLEMENRGTNPWADLRLCIQLRRILKKEAAACVLSFTIKPNLYGAVAARSLGVPCITNISGLGTVFIRETWITTIVKVLYRWGLRAASWVFFQNPDDRDFFAVEGLVDREKTELLPGSGIDTGLYSAAPVAEQPRNSLRFLLLGRMLWDKGVGEYVAAAQSLQERFPECEFVLMGFLGVANATAIPRTKIEEWERSGAVKYLPPTDDVRSAIAKADCVVLPSYREGTPRSLLEAASMGKPIITTDVPGCRQVVDHQRTGFLVKVRDPDDLADKMERMIHLSKTERVEMGQRGRKKMIREFDERIVLDRYIRRVSELINVRSA